MIASHLRLGIASKDNRKARAGLGFRLAACGFLPVVLIMLVAGALAVRADWQTVHRWTFENPAPYNDSVGTANLTPSASGISLFDSGNVTLGQAVRISTSGNLTALQSTLAPIDTNSFQIHFWVQRDQANLVAGLLDTLNNTATGFQIFFQANNTLRLRLDDTLGNYALFDSTATITNDGLWHEIFVTVNRSSTTGLVYQVDGQAQAGQDPTTVPGSLAPSQDLYVGNLNGTAPLFGSLALCEIIVNTGPTNPPPPPPGTVAFSPPSSFSYQPLVVTITANPANAQVRYTTDGSNPTTNSPVYTAPFPVSTSTQFRAAVFTNNAASIIGQAGYTISTNTTPPNMVVFITEDVGAGDLHHYGNPVNATPNFDALARSGVRFSQTYCTGPSNAPNQYAALTGRLLPRSGLPPFIAPGSATGLASREWTLGEAFLKAGYQTAFIGGWHLGDAPSSLPQAQGFQLFYGLAMPLEGAPLTNLRENNTVLDPSPNPTNLLSQFVTRALSFLDANASNRFLLVLQAPPLPANGASQGGGYGNRIEAIDAALGQLTGKLAQLGLLAQTLLVVASDEGPDLTTPLPHGSAGMFRDGRSTTFEGGARIPAYASWAGTIAPAEVSQAVWWLPDLPPTLCAIAGLPWPGDRPMDGTNRIAALTGAAMRPDGTESLFFHRLTNASPNLAAQRLGSVKYHRSLTKSDPENSYTAANLPMLFDAELDPTERFLGFITTLTNSVPALDAAASAHLATFQPPYPQLPPDSTLLGNFGLLPSVGNPPLQLRFTRAADTLDQYYTLETSTDLVNWTTQSLTALVHQTVTLSNGVEQVTLSPPAPQPGVAQSFYRVRANLP
jgi:arylsulfatase A-like enzyme